MEKGQVEEPRNPMIRFSSPVIDGNGGLRGVVVLNSLSASLFDFIRIELEKHNGRRASLINARGYYLFHSEDRERAFGFMFPGGEDYTLGADDPELWELIRRRRV